MRSPVTVLLSLVLACSPTADPQAPPGGSGPGASGQGPGSMDPDAVPATIDALVERLGRTSGLWINGTSAALTAPADAKTDAVLREMFGKMSFDQGHATSFEILEERDVTIKPETQPFHAAYVRTNVGTAVVLLRHDGATGWWTRAYRTLPR